MSTRPDGGNGNPSDRFRYNGKEYQKDHGLYEYRFRWYDAAVARFIQVDPLADDYTYKSTYDYAENEPISNIDLDGLEKLKGINENNTPEFVTGLDNGSNSQKKSQLFRKKVHLLKNTLMNL